MKKEKGRTFKKVFAALSVGALMLSGAIISIPTAESPLVETANAGVAGGGGGGGGGGGWGGNHYWVKYPDKNKLNNGTVGNIPSVWWNSEVCKNAIEVWGLVPGVVLPGNATNYSWGYSLVSVSGNANTSAMAYGNQLVDSVVKNTGWDRGSAANYVNDKNLVCIDNPNVLVEAQWRYEVRHTGTRNDSFTENEIHTYTSTVEPQPIDGKKDPIGADNLNTQSSTFRTHYGRVWDEYKAAAAAPGANTQDLVGLFKDRFVRAKGLDAQADAGRAQVELNPDNQAGLAEGGILNVSEHGRKASASVSTQSRSYEVWRCGHVRYSQTGWQSSGGCGRVTGTMNWNSPPADSIWGLPTSATWSNRGSVNPNPSNATSWTAHASVINPSTETQQNVGFWQIISAHCNEAGLTSLKAAMGGNLTKLESGDGTTNISGLYRTKHYDSRPSVLPLGQNHSSLSSAQRDTAKLGFYDKECPFDCTANNSGSGASDKNGATVNVGNSGTKTSKGLFGAKSSDNFNGNYFELFRDNTDRTIRPDVWYPTNTKGVSYDGSAPKTTLITRWNGGTPKLGTEFNAYVGTGSAKKSIFNVDDTTNQPNQRNFDAAGEFKKSTAFQSKGLVSDVTVQSTWASDANKPQALQFAWEYSPSVTSKVPSTLGFAQGKNVALGGYVDRATTIDGRCWGEFGTTTQAGLNDNKTKLRANTGTGTTTAFSTNNGDFNNRNNLVVNFIRGTSE